MKCYQDNGSWLILTDKAHAWRAENDDYRNIIWAPLPIPLNLTDEEIDALEYFDESEDFPEEYTESIRFYKQPESDNTTYYVFYQPDGSTVIYYCENGYIYTTTPDKEDKYNAWKRANDAYKMLFDEYLSWAESEERSRKRRDLDWKERIRIAANCLDCWEDENGKFA
ncbi:MAG: hypothetical protein IJG83_06990 [Thermoguttaceae bacterium]|nr:hypothetical protein [Thermoguttaceae bacterium]